MQVLDRIQKTIHRPVSKTHSSFQSENITKRMAQISGEVQALYKSIRDFSQKHIGNPPPPFLPGHCVAYGTSAAQHFGHRFMEEGNMFV